MEVPLRAPVEIKGIVKVAKGIDILPHHIHGFENICCSAISHDCHTQRPVVARDSPLAFCSFTLTRENGDMNQIYWPLKIVRIHASRALTIHKFHLGSRVAGSAPGSLVPELPSPLGPAGSLCILLLAEADVKAPEVQRTSGNFHRAWDIQVMKHCSCGAPRFGF